MRSKFRKMRGFFIGSVVKVTVISLEKKTNRNRLFPDQNAVAGAGDGWLRLTAHRRNKWLKSSVAMSFCKLRDRAI